MSNKKLKAQSLIEIIVATGVLVLLVGAGLMALTFTMKSNYDIKSVQTANNLAEEDINILKSLAENNWHSLYNPPAPKGADSQFYLEKSQDGYQLIEGTTSTIVNGKQFVRYFSIEDVKRTNCGIGEITELATTTSCLTTFPGGATDVWLDPSTIKVVSVIKLPQGGEVRKNIYLTRVKNLSAKQINWSGVSNVSSTKDLFFDDSFASSSNIDYSLNKKIKIYGF